MSSSPARPLSSRQERWLRLGLHHFSRVNLWIYRLSGGRLAGRWNGRRCIGILIHRGRKSGVLRAAPLLYVRDGERLVVIASNAGMANEPIWYRNLQATPDCEFEIGSVKHKVRARTASAEEKQRYFPQLVALHSDYTRYQARVSRDIPLVILDPR